MDLTFASGWCKALDDSIGYCGKKIEFNALSSVSHHFVTMVLERHDMNSSAMATIGAVMLSKGMAHTIKPALSHMANDGLRQAPGSKAGIPDDPRERRLKYITHPEAMEKIRPRPKMNNTAWFQ
jgi:hypothetical protein